MAPSFRLKRMHAWVLLLAGHLLAAGCAAQQDAPGRWTGGFLDDHGAWTTLHLRLGDSGGTADVIFPTFGGADNAIGVAASVQRSGGRLRVAIPTRRDTLVLVGRIAADTLAGTYELGRVRGAFGLTRWTYLGIDTLAEYYGAYRVSPDRVISLFRGWGHARSLNYVDYATGEVGTLWPSAEGEFFGGIGLAVSYPVALRASLREGELRWHRAGDTTLVAHRVPIRDVNLRFRHDSVQLAGSLLVPAGEGPHPAIVVIPGDYGTNRDQLRMFAHNFVVAGIAALVFDARGGGASGGPVNSSSFMDLSGDVLAAVDSLAAREDIRSDAIGLFGFSNSAFTASLAAARSERIAFLIMQSFVGVVPWQQESWRAETQLRVDGFPDSVVRLGAQLMGMKYEVARTGRGWDALQERVTRARGEPWLGYTSPPNDLERLRRVYDLVMAYDPIAPLAHVRASILAFWGERDTYLPVPETMANVERVLAQSGHQDHSLRVFPGTSHSILETPTGTPSSGGTERRFPPEVWRMVREWTSEHVRRCPLLDTNAVWVQRARAWSRDTGVRWSNDSLRRVLLGMQDRDQAERAAFGDRVGDSAYVHHLLALDSALAAEMTDILDRFGLPTRSMVGPSGADAAMLIVQHNGSLQERVLTMAASLPAGEISPEKLAMLQDRVLARRGRPQLFGTELTLGQDGIFRVAPIADPIGLDARRAAVGMPPLRQYVCLLEEAGMRVDRRSIPAPRS